MKSVIGLVWATLLVLLCSCSAGDVETGSEELGEVSAALVPACAIGGNSGVSAWPVQTYITEVEIGSTVSGQQSLRVTDCDVTGGPCWTANHTFAKAKWTNIPTYNTSFVGSVEYPLRSIDTWQSGSGCEPTHPGKSCIIFAGDSPSGPLTNKAKFVVDAPVPNMQIRAPLGYGIVKMQGMLNSPSNTWRITRVNNAATGVLTTNLVFAQSGCP